MKRSHLLGETPSDVRFYEERTLERRMEMVGEEDFNGYRKGSIDLKAIESLGTDETLILLAGSGKDKKVNNTISLYVPKKKSHTTKISFPFESIPTSAPSYLEEQKNPGSALSRQL